MEREKKPPKTPYWFDLDKGKTISAILCRLNDEIRVYVVTVSPKDPIFKHWPETK